MAEGVAAGLRVDAEAMGTFADLDAGQQISRGRVDGVDDAAIAS